MQAATGEWPVAFRGRATGVVRGPGPDEGLLEVSVDGTSILVSAGSPPPTGSAVLLQLCARDVLLARDPALRCSARNRIPARVAALRPFGRHLLATLRGAAGLELHAEVSRSAAAELELREGAAVVALFKANAVGLVPGGAAQEPAGAGARGSPPPP